MGITAAQSFTDESHQYVAIILIDAVGEDDPVDGEGRIRFCTDYPDYADPNDTVWQPLLQDFPNLAPERPDVLGGVAEMGELVFNIVDKDDYLTNLLRIEAFPVTALAEDLDSSETGIDVGSTADFTTDDTLFVGSEAMRITAVTSSPARLTVSRGYLGTDAVSHKTDDACFKYTPYLRDRRVTYKIVPKNATSSSEEQEETVAIIDKIGFDPLLNVWRFAAKTEVRHIHRQAPIFVFSGTVLEIADVPVGIETPNERVVQSLHVGIPNPLNPMRPLWTDNTDDLFYLKHEDEIFSISNHHFESGSVFPQSAWLTVGRRGLLGTKEEELAPESRLTQILISDTSIESSFRYSPGPSPSSSRTSGTWTKTDHWVDLCLLIMLSSAHEDDGLELNNRETTGSNFKKSAFDSLPVGYGLGLPSSLVDWDSWEEAKMRTRDIRFPKFIYGHEPMPFADLITDNFLRPIGAYLVFRGGSAKIVLPRTPLLGESAITLGSTDILARKVGRRLYEPGIEEVAFDVAQHSGSVVYNIGPTELPVDARSGTYAGTYGQRGYYGADDRSVTIKVPAADEGDQQIWVRQATKRLVRRHRPRLSMVIKTGLDNFTAGPGDVASITLDEVPDLRNGTRGQTSVPYEILERKPDADLDGLGMHLEFRCLGYSSAQRSAKICPAAYIASVLSDTATVSANRFTHTDAVANLPTTDASAFAVGDVVRLVDLAGADVGGGTQTILTITSNDIELDGDFSATLAAGNLLIYADAASADAVAQQTDSFCFMGERDTSPGVDSRLDIYTYGEP